MLTGSVQSGGTRSMAGNRTFEDLLQVACHTWARETMPSCAPVATSAGNRAQAAYRACSCSGLTSLFNRDTCRCCSALRVQQGKQDRKQGS